MDNSKKKTEKKETKNKNLIITPRDQEIFEALSKYHLTGKLLFELSQTFQNPFTSVANTRARLGQLYETGFLKRSQRLVENRRINESYYFLTKTAAIIWNEFYEDVANKNALFQPIRLMNQAHGFLISEIMVKMENDIKQLSDICQMVGFVRENNFFVKGNDKRMIKPDGTIFLKVNKQNHLLFLEVDLSTETVSSTKRHSKSFRNKIEIYSEFKKQFYHHEVIHRVGGINGYRVLIVCKSKERLWNLANLAYVMNKSHMFWFTTQEWFFMGNSLFDKVWTLPKGQFYPLF